MKWWAKAAWASVLWVLLVIGVAYYHTSVHLKDVISPAQDSAISEAYRRLCAFGVPLIWVIFFLVHRRRRKS